MRQACQLFALQTTNPLAKMVPLTMMTFFAYLNAAYSRCRDDREISEVCKGAGIAVTCGYGSWVSQSHFEVDRERIEDVVNVVLKIASIVIVPCIDTPAI